MNWQGNLTQKRQGAKRRKEGHWYFICEIESALIVKNLDE
jgi:hypothetical protein